MRNNEELIIESRKLYVKVHLTPFLVVSTGGRVAGAEYMTDGADNFVIVHYAGTVLPLKVKTSAMTKLQMAQAVINAVQGRQDYFRREQK